MFGVLKVHPIQALLIIVGMFLCLEVSDAARTAQNGKADSKEMLPIVKVFNTTKMLWLYWKNSTDKTIEMEESQESSQLDHNLTLECTFIRKYNISDKDFNFWWGTKVNGDMMRVPCYGNFSSGGSESLGSMDTWALFVEQQPFPFQTMTLMYTEKKCSVFFVTPMENGAATGCELYVRNKAISEGPSQNCSEYYDNHCKNRTAVYNSTCQTEVEKGVQKFNKWLVSQIVGSVLE
ncbi:uncharacterized protein LOC119402891 isoform X2 [Rhipicephalus sanguineus]|uniref:uncharacterized protein LOC119402891 isoform X2 n=1 Tax=Rhipicephalus sanguineus TaxID=34632 RepID=UPI0018957F97|nr:uncharacterized protein LOC119402891 isoform X2 [Rhipicephalus sanguineus]